jgi:hypothetical protein
VVPAQSADQILVAHPQPDQYRSGNASVSVFVAHDVVTASRAQMFAIPVAPMR